MFRYRVLTLHNIIISSPKSLERVCEITGKKLQQCYDVDIRDRPALETVFAKHKGK
jgi:UDP-glucose 4-epimerase